MIADSAWPAADPRQAVILDLLAQEAQVPREALRPDASIHELGIASLDLVQAIFAIESRFGVELPLVAEGQEAEFATVGDLVRHALATIDAKA